MTAWGGRRVPMTLLGGYLGAGKTTIVNRALAGAGEQGRRLAVLVNDVGDVAVDAALVAARHDDTIELTNGCICCSLVDGFAVALEALRQRPAPPDQVLVELSGVAEPDRVRAWAHTAGFRPDGVVVAVAADQVVDRLADARVGELVAAQLASADLVLLTRSDLVADAAPARAAVRTRSGAPVLDVRDGDVGLGVLLGPTVGEPAARRTRQPARTSVDHVTATVHAPPVPLGELEDRLGLLDPAVVRVKGVVETSDRGLVLVQRVGARSAVVAASRAGLDAPGTPTGLVVIALDGAALAAAGELLGAGG